MSTTPTGYHAGLYTCQAHIAEVTFNADSDMEIEHNVSRKLDRNSFKKFMMSAPLVAADRLSLPGSRALARLDKSVVSKFEHGAISGILRTLILVASAFQRFVIGFATLLVAGAACIVASPAIGGYYGVKAIYAYFSDRSAKAAETAAAAKSAAEGI